MARASACGAAFDVAGANGVEVPIIRVLVATAAASLVKEANDWPESIATAPRLHIVSNKAKIIGIDSVGDRLKVKIAVDERDS